jgi:CTP:molybdopterin cytidylyltransferase MocA
VLRDGGCDPIVVILGAGAAEVVAATDLAGCVVLVNEGWPEGIGASLRCGLAALAGLGAPAVVVALVDQPGVTAAVVRRVVEAWDGRAGGVVPTFDGQPRNPALLAARSWREVAALAVGDVGARAWLRSHPQDVRMVACDDLGNADDIDTPTDLTRLQEDTR